MTPIDPVAEILALGIYSAYIEGDKSVSIILIADPEMNKTRSLMRFSDVKGVKVQTDLTYYGIINEVLPDLKNGRYRTILMPDLLKAIMKKQSTKSNFLTILNALIEEGVYDVTIRDQRSFDGVQANILTSITPGVYRDNRNLLHKIGFWTRVVPFTYSYTSEKVEGIFERIGTYSVLSEKPVECEIPNWDYKVNIGEKATEYAEKLARKIAASETYSEQRISRSGNVYYVKKKGGHGFRHKWQMQCLLKASAVMRQDCLVNELDIDRLRRLSRWINYDFKPLK